MITCPKCKTQYDGAERFCPKDGTRLGTGEVMVSKMPSLSPGSDPLINKIISGRYKVLSQIGEGGMGVVYEAEHIEIEKKVALKVLRDDFSKRPEVVARFRQEARSAGKIGNAHIVDVTDFGQLDNGGVYFVMEHLQGRGLNEVIRDENITVERGVYIVLQIAKALKAAHKMGIVHRDLKPENVFLVENDEEKDFVKILDFGIAKISDRDSEGQRLTKTGMIFGTPEYMSPEQAAGKTLDHRVDIYALGCIMFEMFTGRVPFDGETFMAVLTQHMFEPPPELEDINPEACVPQEVKAVIYKAMAKDKEDRYSDMIELSEDLERAMLGTGATIRDNSAIWKLADYRMTHGVKEEGESSRVMSLNTMDLIPIDAETPRKKSGATIVLGVVILLLVGLGAAAYFGGFISGKMPGDSKEEKVEHVASQIEMKVGDTAENSGSETEEMLSTETEKPAQEGVAGDSETAEEKEKIAVKPENTTEKDIVMVTIDSDPEGGTVIIEGMGQVCSETPCEVSLEDGVPVEVEIVLNKKSGKMTFTPSDQNKTLRISLYSKTPRRGGRRTPRNDGGRNGSSGSSKTDGDLKIPNIFKNN